MMTKSEALTIVYDLAQQNVLTASEGDDIALLQEALRQRHALDVVYEMLSQLTANSE